MDRPLQLVSIPAGVSLFLAVIAILAAVVWLFAGRVAIEAQASGVIVNPPGNNEVSAPVSGAIELGPPLLGTVVGRGQVIASLRTHEGRIAEVRAPIEGMVVALATGNNGTVKTGDPLLTLAPMTQPMIAYVFVPTATASSVARGDRVTVAPIDIDTSVTGRLVGTVEEVVPLPASPERIDYLVTDEQLAANLASSGPVNEVIVSFVPNPGDPSQLTWTGKGPGTAGFIVSGETVTATISLAEESPWQGLLGI